jgi:hypothetical protein
MFRARVHFFWGGASSEFVGFRVQQLGGRTAEEGFGEGHVVRFEVERAQRPALRMERGRTEEVDAGSLPPSWMKHVV